MLTHLETGLLASLHEIGKWGGDETPVTITPLFDFFAILSPWPAELSMWYCLPGSGIVGALDRMWIAVDCEGSERNCACVAGVHVPG